MAERGKYGAGSLRPRGEGRWELRTNTGWDVAANRYGTVTRTFHGTEKQARKALGALVAEVGAGKRKGTDATIGDLLDAWMAHARAHGLEELTLSGYASKIRVHIRPAFGTTQVRKVTAGDLDRWYVQLGRQGLSPATVRQIHAIVRKALGQGVRWGWIAANPALSAQAPRLRKSEIRPPDPKAVGRALEAADPELAMFLRLAASTGARRGELTAARWADIDFLAGALLIAHAVVRALRADGTTDLVVKDTKTHQARPIAIGRETVAALAEHRRLMEQRAATAHTKLATDAFVFSPEPDGSAPWDPDHWSGAWARLRAKTGVTGRLHDLRHLAATQLLSQGVDPVTVAGRLGHATPSTTLGIYAHFVPARDRAAADLLDTMLEG